MKSIILLSGPVGAGKSTVAQEFVKQATEPMVYIEGDKFWSFMVKPNPEDDTLKNFKLLMRAITTAALPFVIADYPVLIDFSIPPWYVEAVFSIVNKRDIPVHYVILRPDEEICVARAASRAEGAIDDYSRFKRLYASFESAQQHTIYDNESSPETLARNVKEGVDEGMFLVTNANFPPR